ncbi:Na+/H+ antiporter subunit E [Palleronia marisminoris]|uniref:Na+/H+ antiporter subunit E n=1 Tax=Palleronia marisminoris TaxID=315423 RepID=UPI000A2672C3
MGKRLLPHPALSLLLAVVWCLLTNSLTVGTLVMAVILGLVVPALTAPYWPHRPSTPKLFRLTSYIILVIWDIVVANARVAFIVLFRSNASMRSEWLVIPLELKTPEAITILAGTITLTPGTVSADLADDGRCLLVHALDSADPAADVRDIKERYERRLKEIFE